MRRYGLYDATRGLTTALAAGAAGVLLWAATQVGQQTTGRFWAEMGIVAGAGLVVSLAQVIAGWTKGLRLRFSPGTFLLGFLPVLVVAGWILLATQPGNGWHEARMVSWSTSIGVTGLVHAVGLWHGVLAFGFGLVLGMTFDTVPALVEDEAVVARREAARAPVTASGPDTAPGTVAMDRRAADDPLTAEREAALAAEPKTVVVGPVDERRS
ncbi:MAG: hypothetical protein QOI27_985 [Gaiellaceae bacterium]|nr:hypothetical protein [Gaiellaceae bacterium]